jgi:serine/threonine protein phosphatase PrpC
MDIQQPNPEMLNPPFFGIDLAFDAKYGESYQINESIQAVGEDTVLVDKEAGIFGVFDGMGGMKNGAKASQAAAQSVLSRLHNIPETRLKQALNVARRRVRIDGEGGFTTALICQIVRYGGSEFAIEWANAGDCRLGLVREGELTWISTEQGQNNLVDNGLGPEVVGWPEVQDETGSLQLRKGDIVFLASDGITGDWPDQQLTDYEIVECLTGSDPASRLLAASKKIDDKSLIVIQI